MNECSISTFGSIRVTCQRGLTIYQETTEKQLCRIRCCHDRFFPNASLDAESVETDANGSATIKGEYDGNSKLTTNGKEVKQKTKRLLTK